MKRAMPAYSARITTLLACSCSFDPRANWNRIQLAGGNLMHIWPIVAMRLKPLRVYYPAFLAIHNHIDLSIFRSGARAPD